MTQHSSRWTLASTGNRLMYAVAAGLLVSLLAAAVDVHGTARLVVFGLAAAVTYVVLTALRGYAGSDSSR